MEGAKTYRRRNPVTTVTSVMDLCPLVGFELSGLEKVDGDGIYMVFENGNVVIDVLYDGQTISLTAPYAVDRDGHRI